jgi:uncharacterized repeat protein (TIGR01451 family)
VDKQVVKPYGLLTYTIKVTNTGKTVQTNLKITDNLPAYTSFVSSKTGKLQKKDGKEYVEWNVDRLAAGESVEVSFVVKVDNCLPYDYVIKNTATASSDDEPGTPSNTVRTVTKLTAVNANPQTGDESKTGLYVVIAMAAAVLAAAALILPRRRRRSSK